MNVENLKPINSNQRSTMRHSASAPSFKYFLLYLPPGSETDYCLKIRKHIQNPESERTWLKILDSQLSLREGQRALFLITSWGISDSENMDQDELLRRHHQIFAEDNEPFSEDWTYDYFEKYSDRLDIEHSEETDSDNYSSGDEQERIHSQRHKDETFYWISTSSGGPGGPFAKLNDAISALGYDPKTFEIE